MFFSSHQVFWISVHFTLGAHPTQTIPVWLMAPIWDGTTWATRTSLRARTDSSFQPSSQYTRGSLFLEDSSFDCSFASFPNSACKSPPFPMASRPSTQKNITVLGLLSFCNFFVLGHFSLFFKYLFNACLKHYAVIFVPWGQGLVLFCLPQICRRHWIFAE